MANTEKTQEHKTARDGETGRKRWRTDESCREQPDSVEEASLSLHLSLGASWDNSPKRSQEQHCGCH